ncbi:hypothetical protein CANARDRAFT_27187 [[Candida] arabinofermentans NRRL YB-2248]|uniref:Zn(2)-C6 fungal-type domain-containing protein n=1 Tax=[Candida] arabinofermentans NRRL YB-2248 TaxID=983967 RepID=A0A1E4T554_9ASCO|nr:hypothetical protein CANARDRAFT_27187 [[Candida] arabinofermentans NRRL YB-2248]
MDFKFSGGKTPSPRNYSSVPLMSISHPLPGNGNQNQLNKPSNNSSTSSSNRSNRSFNSNLSSSVVTLPPLTSSLNNNPSTSTTTGTQNNTTLHSINDYSSHNHPLLNLNINFNMNGANATPNSHIQDQQSPQVKSDTQSQIQLQTSPMSIYNTSDNSTRSRNVPRSLPDSPTSLQSKGLTSVSKIKSKSEKESSSSRISKRSRKGCLTCRFRKRKCCERRPICTECDRLGIKCSWITNGLENKNKSKKNPHFLRNDECYDVNFGVIKIIRGKIDYRIIDGELIEGDWYKSEGVDSLDGYDVESYNNGNSDIDDNVVDDDDEEDDEEADQEVVQDQGVIEIGDDNPSNRSRFGIGNPGNGNTSGGGLDVVGFDSL